MHIARGVDLLIVLCGWLHRLMERGWVAVQAGSDKVDMDIGYGAVVDDYAPKDKELEETRRSDTEESKALAGNGTK